MLLAPLTIILLSCATSAFAANPRTYILALYENTTTGQAQDYENLKNALDPLINDRKTVMNRDAIGYFIPDFRTVIGCSRKTAGCGLSRLPTNAILLPPRTYYNMFEKVAKIIEYEEPINVKRSQLLILTNINCTKVKTRDIYPDVYDIFYAKVEETLRFIEEQKLHTYLFWNRMDNTDGPCYNVGNGGDNELFHQSKIGWDTPQLKEELKKTFFAEWSV